MELGFLLHHWPVIVFKLKCLVCVGQGRLNFSPYPPRVFGALEIRPIRHRVQEINKFTNRCISHTHTGLSDEELNGSSGHGHLIREVTEEG